MAELKAQLQAEDSDSELEFSDALENNVDEFTDAKGSIEPDEKFFDTHFREPEDGVGGSVGDGKVESDGDNEEEPDVDLLKIRREGEDKLSEEEREVKNYSLLLFRMKLGSNNLAYIFLLIGCCCNHIKLTILLLRTTKSPIMVACIEVVLGSFKAKYLPPS